MKITKLIAMCLLTVSLSAAAQKKTEILLWDEKPLEQTEAKSERVKAQDFKTDPAITVYTPKNPTGKTVLMCPGGGYSHQASAHEGHDMADWYNAQGITYAVLKYRLPYGDHTIPLADAEQAMRILRRYAEQLGVDPKKVGVAGASAGGHLASTLATHYSSPETRPDFQILFYPVISMDEKMTHMGSRKNLLGENPPADLVRRYSNEYQVTKDTPKAFIMLSSDDGAVPPTNSIYYYYSLINHKVPVSLHAYPTGGHGWGFRDKFPYKRQWTGELEKWLREAIY